MLTPSMVRLIERQRLGFVATVSADGTPNLSPKGTFAVIDEHTLAFGEIRSPNTIRNLASNPAVEINFVDPLARRGVRARGVAVAWPRGSTRYADLLSAFTAWSTLVDRIRHVVVIEVRSAAEICTPAYDAGATEQDLRAYWTQRLLEPGDP